MSLQNYVVWPPRRPWLTALGAVLWLALAGALVVRADQLTLLTIAAAGMFLVLGGTNLLFDLPWSGLSMCCFGLSHALWNLPGPEVSWMSAVSATCLVVALPLLVQSHRADEMSRFDERIAGG